MWSASWTEVEPQGSGKCLDYGHFQQNLQNSIYALQRKALNSLQAKGAYNQNDQCQLALRSLGRSSHGTAMVRTTFPGLLVPARPPQARSTAAPGLEASAAGDGERTGSPLPASQKGSLALCGPGPSNGWAFQGAGFPQICGHLGLLEPNTTAGAA